MSAFAHLADSEVRRLTKVLRHVLDRETFTSVSDLKAAFTDALSRHRIAYEPADLDAAFALVGSNRPLLAREPRPPAEPLAPDPLPLSKRDAAAVFTELRQRFDVELKTIQPLHGNSTQHEQDVRKQADAMRGRAAPLSRRPRRVPYEERLAEIFKKDTVK